ncbi:hypothetical protein D5H75_14870 [Bailinhaonella thermotolerans]|uniref:Uncharacterized protein n=1 Tax=Bailinhaonella thermotolerans TaxID=1070861 RepID=A0A3A4BEZ1_9ACTN|nr:hypothetical protein D5H75_14870 [Bailinhaonella thermotolerans]
MAAASPASPQAGAAPAVSPAGTAAATGRAAEGCDPIDPGACLLPFPNDHFTVADPATATGRRVAFAERAMPRSAAGTPIAPGEWNRSDGFSPGSMMLALVPGVDLARTGAAPITDIGRSLDRRAPIVLLDLTSGERRPYWAELDAGAPPERRALIVRPARNLREGHRYAIALRNLRDAAGNAIPANPAFAAVAGDPLPPGHELRDRQRRLRPALEALRRHGVGRDGLYLAWDFTVASERGLAERALRMRDEALRELAGRSPSFEVTSVTDFTPEQNAQIARRVEGTVRVPSYLDRPGGPPGSGLNYGPDGLPARLPGNTQAAPFRCELPRAAFTRPARAALYGHGLLGRHAEVGAGNVATMAERHGFAFCATKWIGMSDEDIPSVIATFSDMSRFHAIPDRTQQAFLGFVFLGRAMIEEDGFTSHPAFRAAGGRPLIDVRHGLVFDGNSQGGILGGALVALSPDIRRGVLGVTGMNYSTLFNRSADSAPFQAAFDRNYPDKLDQQLILALMQMLWDRGEANGYAAHMTGDPYPGTPRHRVLMHVAFGDHQVATVTADVEARTIGARLMAPALASGRSPDRVPYWGVPAVHGPAWPGSALVVWDSGTPPPPVTNTPPAEGTDPHEDPRRTPAAQLQKAIFLKTGVVADVCGPRPCVSDPR